VDTLILILIITHIIGAIITMVIHYKNGTFESASKYGDGIRFARPSDVVILDCIAWEVLLLLFVIEFVDKKINNSFYRKV
jgi:hypothetical protein